MLASGWLLTPRAAVGAGLEWPQQDGSPPHGIPVPPPVIAVAEGLPTEPPAQGFEDLALVWRNVPPVEIDLLGPAWETADLDTGAPAGNEMGPTEREEPYFAPTLDLGMDLYYLRLVMPPNAENFRYKIDPTFGLEDRNLQIRGIMLRFKLDF